MLNSDKYTLDSEKKGWEDGVLRVNKRERVAKNGE